LVLATGLRDDPNQIENFKSAWEDVDHPVFSNIDPLHWRSNVHKYFRHTYSFNHGNAYFCIPPYPFRGEIGAYNFFISKEVFNWYSSHGKLSPLHSFTVVNANDKFC
jgi:sulfide:quinone oxidoreductase